MTGAGTGGTMLGTTGTEAGGTLLTGVGQVELVGTSLRASKLFVEAKRTVFGTRHGLSSVLTSLRGVLWLCFEFYQCK
jgi:hypothetical protein